MLQEVNDKAVAVSATLSISEAASDDDESVDIVEPKMSLALPTIAVSSSVLEDSFTTSIDKSLGICCRCGNKSESEEYKHPGCFHD